MSRLSIRPRPLDIHKKLPIVKSVQEFEDDETGPTTNFFAGASARNSHVFFRRSSELESEGHSTPSKKNPQEIPTPQYNVVESYERMYTCTFAQPTSYLRSRGARTEIGEFIEYDLDNEDEDWLEEFNNDRKILTSDK